jgi:hypothetical protein
VAALSKTFQGIPAAHWEAIKNRFTQETGLHIDANEGSGKDTHGIGFAWLYSPVNQTLTITVTNVPLKVRCFGYDENRIISEFTSWVNQVR